MWHFFVSIFALSSRIFFDTLESFKFALAEIIVISMSEDLSSARKEDCYFDSNDNIVNLNMYQQIPLETT